MKGLAGLAALLTLAAAGPAGAVTATGTLTANIVRPIVMTKNVNLSFGKIVRPASGTVTATLATTGARTFTPPATSAFWLVSPASTVANFTVSGEGAQAFTLTIPATVTLTNSGAGGGTLSVTTSNDAGCTTACALSGSLGGAGSKTFNVGGSFPITSSTAAGAYSGSVTATAAYN